MKQIFLSTILALLSGCATSMMAQDPVRKTITLQTSPDVAYQRAATALAQMGGQLTLANPQTRLLSSTLKGVVVLNVQVEAADGGSTVEATGTLLPGKVVLGRLDEVDEYLARVR